MAYNKHTWADGVNGGTPITAEKLNEIEQGIEDNSLGVYQLNSDVMLNACKSITSDRTLKGVTFRNIGNGQIELSGTASEDIVLALRVMLMKGHTHKKVKVKLVGCPEGGSENSYSLHLWQSQGKKIVATDYGEGSIIELPQDWGGMAEIHIKSGVVCDNLRFNPMLTNNLNATYDDYIPFTGSFLSFPSYISNMNTLCSGIGDITTLSTENKNTLVAAINELYNKVTALESK